MTQPLRTLGQALLVALIVCGSLAYPLLVVRFGAIVVVVGLFLMLAALTWLDARRTR